MKPLSLALAAMLFALVPGAGGPAAGQTPGGPGLILLSSAGRRALPTTGSGEREMVALDDLAAAFQLSLRDDPLAGGMTVTYKGKTIAVMADQPIASVGGRLVSLPAPVVRDGRRWLVPIDFIPRALALVYDVRLDFRKSSHLVIAGDLRVPRVTVREDVDGPLTRVTLETSPRAGVAVAQDQNRLLVRFDADALDVSLPGAGVLSGVVDSIRLADPGNAIAIVLGPKFGSYKTSSIQSDAASARIVIDVMPAGMPSIAAAVPPPAALPAPPAAPPLPPVEPLPAPAAPGVRTIVIDPGHGGTEEGARGPGGTLEKDVTLSVARRLKATIESRLGLRVLLTRDDDTAVSLDDRAAFANNNRADLFISLHANASLKKDVRGAEVFYLSADGYAQAREEATTAASLPALGGGSREIDVILWEVAQMQHLSQSAAFAAMIEQELRARVPMSTMPVQQAPFRVLVGANMPAVLIEMGFLTNPEQEQALGSGEFQATFAQALFDAIARFRDSIERGRPSGPPGPPSRSSGLP